MNYIFVIDFEATCWENKDNKQWCQEIIEFPCVVIDVQKAEIIDIFHEYISPVINPQLSQYCINLTGITQKQVDNGALFSEVVERFETFYRKYQELSEQNPILILTVGNWDFGTAYKHNCKLFGIENKFRTWCDIKLSFKNAYHTNKAGGMVKMLNFLGLPLIGRHHSGIDDAKNTAQIVLTMIKNDFIKYLNVNGYLDW